MLALRVPAALAPVTLAFELQRGGARVRARDGGAFAVPVGMAAGDPSVLGARLSALCIVPASAITSAGAFLRHPVGSLLHALLAATHHVLKDLYTS